MDAFCFVFSRIVSEYFTDFFISPDFQYLWLLRLNLRFRGSPVKWVLVWSTYNFLERQVLLETEYLNMIFIVGDLHTINPASYKCGEANKK